MNQKLIADTDSEMGDTEGGATLTFLNTACLAEPAIRAEFER